QWFREFVVGRHSRVPTDPALAATVQELLTHFPGRITSDGEYVKLRDVGARLSFAEVSTYASLALTHSADMERAIFVSDVNENVLLTDGTRVKSYFSLTALVAGNAPIR